MKKIENFEQINEAGDFKNLPAGIYPLVIKEVVDVPEREYLDIHFDICSGENKDYYSATNKGYGSSIRSYKETALPFFKAFITAVEKSNPGYKWGWDEKKLAGKHVIGVFGEEEYLAKNDEGKLEKRVGTKCFEFRSLEAFKEGKIKVPELKKLSDEDEAKLAPVASAEPELVEIPDDKLPW